VLVEIVTKEAINDGTCAFPKELTQTIGCLGAVAAIKMKRKKNVKQAWSELYHHGSEAVFRQKITDDPPPNQRHRRMFSLASIKTRAVYSSGVLGVGQIEF